ncbi:MAG: N-formylglutamate amidohydrolase [Deltaproteobacteria bacterium]|nr:N-formylglutamate amidohydrolase [Deltaproteobacteria bacterium]
MSTAIVVTCEHASRALPEEVGDLGLTGDVLSSHVAWDPGAAPIARALSARLAAPCELGAFSRLLVDLNRSADNPSVIPEVAFGVPVPGNQSLSGADRAHRIATWHQPYWQRVESLLREGIERAGTCLHVSIHSFTPELDPDRRTFPIGLLFKPDSELEGKVADRVARVLRERGYGVEYNEPYPGTMDLIITGMRARLGGYLGLEIEINHALMKGPWESPLVEALAAGVVAG